MKKYTLEHKPDTAWMEECEDGEYVNAEVAERLYKQLKCCRDMLEAASWMNSGFVIFVEDADEALDLADNN